MCSTLSKATVLGSIVVKEGRIRDYRELVNVACAIVKHKEGTSKDISVQEIIFCPKTRVFVVLYEIPASSRRRCMKSQRCSEKERESMK